MNLSEDILPSPVVRLLLFLLYIIIIMQQENFVCMKGVEKKYVCNLYMYMYLYMVCMVKDFIVLEVIEF